MPLKANALSAYLLGFEAHYGAHGNTVGSCYSCNVCHASALVTNAGNLVAYGTAWFNAWKVREPARVTDEAIDANANLAFTDVEAVDSDGDGSTNITEIMSGSNPNVSSSVPGNTGCQSVSSSSSSGQSSLASTGIDSSINANALNAKCGFQGTGAAMVAQREDPVRDLTEILFFLLPILVVAVLKSTPKSANVA